MSIGRTKESHGKAIILKGVNEKKYQRDEGHEKEKYLI
jgi:hypothetical protein